MKKRKTAIYKITAPAKINAGLRILSKRKDGYHNLETIFYPVKLSDELTVKIRKISETTGNTIISVNTDSKEKISGKNNICYKTVDIFLSTFGIKGSHKIDVYIKKNIPTGAGLGGGSSDAAALLKILLKHFRIKGSAAAITRIALAAGSDVPFFLVGKAAYATGRGEKLTHLSQFRIKGKILLVNPGIHISTPWAFKALAIKGVKRKLLNRVKKFSIDNSALMINDFERVVFSKYPEFEKIKYDMLSLGAEYALMSGSGSTVYGVFKNEDIKAAEKYFKLKKYKVFVC